MICGSCKNKNAYRVRLTESGFESCNSCGGLANLWTPDVSFTRPYLDPNLAHPNRPWEKDGVWIESKRHKATLMKEQKLREGGDRRHGSINFDPKLARRVREQ